MEPVVKDRASNATGFVDSGRGAVPAGLSAVGMFLVALILPAAVLANGGTLDRSFAGGAGYLRYAGSYEARWRINGVLALPDGRPMVGGYADQSFVVRRYGLDGNLDTDFGSGGTTEIPEFSRSLDTPTVRLQRGAGGAAYFELDGLVRRLNASGFYDPSYRPAKINTRGYFGDHAESLASYSLLIMEDARIVVVTAQDAPGLAPSVSVRFYQPDGLPDTTRGDANGERLVNPGWPGRFLPANAVLQADGRILILARWVRDGGRFGLVLLRLNGDGSVDTSFGEAGRVVVGGDINKVSTPRVAVSGEGRIAVVFGVDGLMSELSTSYFVARFYRSNGALDTTLPSGGVMPVILPNTAGGSRRSYFVTNDQGGPSFMGEQLVVPVYNVLWRFNPAADLSVPVALVRADGSRLPAVVSFGGGMAWGSVSEGAPIWHGRLYHGLSSGAAYGLPLDEFVSGSMQWIRATIVSSLTEPYQSLRVFSDGQITVVHPSWSTMRLPEEEEQGYRLRRFDAGGQLQQSFGTNGDLRLGDPGQWRAKLVDEPEDRLTIGQIRIENVYPRLMQASVLRMYPDGTPDQSFAVDGKWALDPTHSLSYWFLASGDAPWALHIDDGWVLLPRRYGLQGFVGEGVPLPDGAWALSVNRTHDGGLQAVRAGRASDWSKQLGIFRWLADGRVASNPGSASPVIEMPQPYGDVWSIDSQIDQSGRTVVAIFLMGSTELTPNHLVKLMRLNVDGTRDMTFGQGGAIDIGVANFESGLGVVRVILQSDEKIVVGYNTRTGDGTAIMVARYLPNGQPDLSFTADGRHESLFSATGDDLLLDMKRAPDGKLVVAGASGSKGLLFRLYGETTPPPATPVPIVEFYNSRLQHYFVTGGAGEIAAIESGAAGPGWSRTGQSFKAYAPESGIAPGALPVCRFYGTPGVGPNSHFYTVDSTECENVKRDPGWSYEGLAFYLFAPNNGACAAGQVPVYRAYNMRFAQNDSNHRYSTDSTIYAQMLAQGWAGEGVKFCGIP